MFLERLNSPKTKRNRLIWREDSPTIRSALWRALDVVAVSIVDSRRLELPIPSSCTIRRWHRASGSAIRTNDLRKSMYTLCQSDPPFPCTFFLWKRETSHARQTHFKWENKSWIVPFSSNISSATVLDHSWLIALKKSAMLLCHRKLNTVYIFSSSAFAVFAFCGMRFHRKRALQLKLQHFPWQIQSIRLHERYFICSFVFGELTDHFCRDTPQRVQHTIVPTQHRLATVNKRTHENRMNQHIVLRIDLDFYFYSLTSNSCFSSTAISCSIFSRNIVINRERKTFFWNEKCVFVCFETREMKSVWQRNLTTMPECQKNVYVTQRQDQRIDVATHWWRIRTRVQRMWGEWKRSMNSNALKTIRTSKMNEFYFISKLKLFAAPTAGSTAKLSNCWSTEGHIPVEYLYGVIILGLMGNIFNIGSCVVKVPSEWNIFLDVNRTDTDRHTHNTRIYTDTRIEKT